MPVRSHLTIGEIARQSDVPEWLVRRVVDALGEQIPRAGLYRLVPIGLLPRIEVALTQRNGERERGATGAA